MRRLISRSGTVYFSVRGCSRPKQTCNLPVLLGDRRRRPLEGSAHRVRGATDQEPVPCNRCGTRNDRLKGIDGTGPVRAIQDDDFALFVLSTRSALVRFATTLTAGDEHLAEDLVQIALIRVYLAKPSQSGNLHAYVRTALVRGLIDHKRRPFIRHERLTTELPEHESGPASDGVDPQLMQALAALPLRMRAAVVLRHVEGLSVEEAAAALRCSAGNVKSQTARGLDKLRASLRPDAPGPPLAHQITANVPFQPGNT